MDTKRSAPGTTASTFELPAFLRPEGEGGNLLFWPADSATPDPKHFLRAVPSPAGEDAKPVFFVTLDHEAEAKARDAFASALGAKLRSLRGERPRHEIAQYMGRHHNTIAKFERGEAIPDAWEMLRLSRFYELPIEKMFDGAIEQPLTQEGISKEFVLVPEYGVRASAGIGTLVDSEDIVGRFAFRRSWLDSRGIRADALAVVSADGDSMEPTVRDTDILLVDTSVQGVRADGIYLIEQAGELRCKRLQAMVGGGVKIRSDNPKYETEVVTADHADLLRVVAKVIWIGGER